MYLSLPPNFGSSTRAPVLEGLGEYAAEKDYTCATDNSLCVAMDKASSGPVDKAFRELHTQANSLLQYFRISVPASASDIDAAFAAGLAALWKAIKQYRDAKATEAQTAELATYIRSLDSFVSSGEKAFGPALNNPDPKAIAANVQALAGFVRSLNDFFTKTVAPAPKPPEAKTCNTSKWIAFGLLGVAVVGTTVLVIKKGRR